MTKEIKGKIRFYYGIFLALFTVVIGVLFIVQTWSIYRSASSNPYTVESISKHFKQIALPVWLWVGAVIAYIPIGMLLPEESQRLKAKIELTTILARTKKRLPTEGDFLPQITQIAQKEERFRKIVGIASLAFVGVIAFVCLATLLDWFYLPIFKREFFTAHDGAVDRISQTAILTIVALSVVCVALFLNNRSRKIEHKQYLDILVEAKRARVELPVSANAEETKKKWQWKEFTPATKKKVTLGIRIGLAALGVAFVIIGIYNGGMRDVLMKAINICTQCIGLG